MPNQTRPQQTSPTTCFDQMCHDIKNPLMVIRGRAQLVERTVQRTAELPEPERKQVLASLAAIDVAVLNIVDAIDDWGATFLPSGSNGKSVRAWTDSV